MPRYVKFIGILLVVLGVGWSAVWYYIRASVQSNIEMSLGDMKNEGIDFSCASLTYGGYPFQVIVDCKQGKLVADHPALGPVTLTFDHGSASSTAYDPSKVIAEFEGSAEVAMSFGEPLLVSFDLLRASFSGGQDFQDLRISGENITASSPAFSVDPRGKLVPVDVTLGSIMSNLYIDRSSQSYLDEALEEYVALRFELTSQAKDLVVQPEAAPLEVGIKMSGEPFAPEFTQNLENFALAESKLQIDWIDVKSAEDAFIRLSGDLSLGRDGYPLSAGQVLFVNLSKFSKAVATINQQVGTAMLGVLFLGGQAGTFGEHKAVTIDVKAGAGMMEFGRSKIQLPWPFFRPSQQTGS